MHRTRLSNNCLGLQSLREIFHCRAQRDAVTDTFENRQTHIDALLKSVREDPIPVQKRLLRCAKIGMEVPTALTSNEVQQVCYALVVHYAQMGIGE